MACGPDGGLYLTEWWRVRKVALDGTVTTLAGGNEGGFVDGAGAQARFNRLTGVVVDSLGNVYVADTENQRIRKITPKGMVSTLAGSGKPGSNDGPASNAQFDNPFGVAVGPTNDIYVSEYPQDSSYRIRIISPAGKVRTLATGP